MQIPGTLECSTLLKIYHLVGLQFESGASSAWTPNRCPPLEYRGVHGEIYERRRPGGPTGGQRGADSRDDAREIYARDPGHPR